MLEHSGLKRISLAYRCGGSAGLITSDSMDEGAPANGEDPATGGEFLIANFARSSILFDRMSFLFKMGLINDQFIRNERALLVEDRKSVV